MDSKIFLFERWEREINEGYCLEGKNYLDLLSVCFQHCDSFTLFIWYDKTAAKRGSELETKPPFLERMERMGFSREKIAPEWDSGFEMIPQIPEELERFRLPLGRTVENIDKQFGYHGVDPNDPRYYVEFRRYKICDVTKKYLQETVNNLFDWVVHTFPSNPENISFFREDESLFLYSCTHEGYCVLTPRKDEDISKLTKHKAWQPVTQEVMDQYPV